MSQQPDEDGGSAAAPGTVEIGSRRAGRAGYAQAQHHSPRQPCGLMCSSMAVRNVVPTVFYLVPQKLLRSENGYRAMIRFAETISFLPDVHTLEFVVVLQMIAAVFKFVDSIEFKVARRLRRLEKKFVPWKEFDSLRAARKVSVPRRSAGSGLLRLRLMQ